MSYNISFWKTKELTGLRIALPALAECDELDEPTIDLETDTLAFEGLAEVFELRGKRDGEYLAVEHIEYWGVGSGRNFDDLKALLENSTGVLVATLVWEGGSSVSRLVVRDGVVSSEKIDL